jgi:hypothetical protein
MHDGGITVPLAVPVMIFTDRATKSIDRWEA